MSSAKKRGLGKGLEALIPEVVNLKVEEEVQGDKIQSIDINLIHPNKNQPRKDFDGESLMELAQSIKAHGMIQPIIVTKQDQGYMIIAGERRWRAAKEIELKEIPCIVREYSEQQLVEVALIENLQRENLNVIEEATAYKYIIDKYNVTQEQLAEALGKSRPYIANTLRLLQLDPRVLDMIKEGRISGGHGRALLRIGDLEKQYQVALKVEKEKINVRQLEQLVGKMLQPQEKQKKEKQVKDIIVIEIEEQLKNFFGTKVNIIKGQRKGKIEIEYYNEEDLNRIIDLINSAK